MKFSGGVFDSWETPKENAHILLIESVGGLNVDFSVLEKEGDCR